MAMTPRDIAGAAEAYYAQRDRLPMFTVYRPVTSDYPGQWVARLIFALPEEEKTDLVLWADSLEDLRAALPPGLYRIERDSNDNSTIEESWL
jgi:hypothetical protein